MDKNLISMIDSVIKPFLVPRKAEGSVGSPSINNILYLPQWTTREVLEYAFLALVSWVICVPKLCVVCFVVVFQIRFGYCVYSL